MCGSGQDGCRGKGKATVGGGVLVLGAFKVFGGEPRKVWVLSGDFLCFPFPILRNGGGDFFSF